MSDEQRANGADGDTPIKVNDRRRFTPEGEVREDAPPEQAANPPPPAPEPDPRDAAIAQQQARIDELMRAYAATVDEGKAARARSRRRRGGPSRRRGPPDSRVLVEEGRGARRRAHSGGGAAVRPAVRGG